MKGSSPLDADADEEGQAHSKVDVKYIGADCIGHSHVTKPIPCY